jgi:hypothetical protein
MQEAIAKLQMAGFDRADVSVPVQSEQTTPDIAADNPITPSDQRQIRTMGSSMAAAAGGIAAAGITVATGGAAAVVIGAAVVAGAGAGLLTNAATSPSDGAKGAGDALPGQKLLLTVRTGTADREARARQVMQAAGALQIMHARLADTLEAPIP